MSIKTLSVFSLAAAMLFSQAKPAAPKLEFAFDLHLQLGKPVDVGKTGPAGLRRVVPVVGGTLEGPGVKGKIQPGADYQIIHSDGLTEIDAHYVVQTEKGDLLYLVNRGVRHGPADVLAKLNAGEKVDQSVIYFRTVVFVETAAEEFAWMNRTIFVTRGERLPNEALIHVYRVN